MKEGITAIMVPPLEIPMIGTKDMETIGKTPVMDIITEIPGEVLLIKY